MELHDDIFLNARKIIDPAAAPNTSQRLVALRASVDAMLHDAAAGDFVGTVGATAGAEEHPAKRPVTELGVTNCWRKLARAGWASFIVPNSANPFCGTFALKIIKARMDTRQVIRLQSNSPCINAGRNVDAPAGFDLDGNPRIVGGTVDMGAYEFQSPQSAISYAWRHGDNHNNWHEWCTWTDPTDSLSALRLLSPIAGTNGIQIRWQSVSGQNYLLERRSGLGSQQPFAPLDSNIIGQVGATTYWDTNAPGIGPFFYRVGVRE